MSDQGNFTLNIAEEDGSPSTYPYKLKVTNDSLTDNGDSTASLAILTPTVAASTYVPYTGATSDVDLGTKDLAATELTSKAVNDYATIGSDLVTNGTFTGSATGWILGSGWTYANASVGSIASTPTAGGSGYTAGDTLTITTGDGTATVTVETVDGSGVVLTLTTKPITRGATYSTGAGQATSGGTGTNCTVNIDSIWDNLVYHTSGTGRLEQDITGTAAGQKYYIKVVIANYKRS